MKILALPLVALALSLGACTTTNRTHKSHRHDLRHPKQPL